MKDFLRRSAPFIISGLTIVVTFVLQFVVLGFDREFAWSEFLPQFFINMFLLVTTSVVWLNSGTDRAKMEEGSAYKQNSTIYANKIKTITDKQQLGRLREFCDFKSDEMLTNKENTKLLNVGIDRATYETIKNKPAAELKKAGYSFRQRRMVRIIREGRVRVRKIKAVEIMSNSQTYDDCGVNYDENLDKTARISFRVVKSAVMTLVMALLVIDLATGITDKTSWILFAMRLFTIVWTAFSSEHEGYARITDTKNKVILRRITFLHEFNEWDGVPKAAPNEEKLSVAHDKQTNNEKSDG